MRFVLSAPESQQIGTVLRKEDFKWYVGFCSIHFSDFGCSYVPLDKLSEHRLCRVPVIDHGNIEAFEDYVSFDENVLSHSDGALNAPALMGRRCCRSCLYITTEGISASPPATSIESIKTSLIIR